MKILAKEPAFIRVNSYATTNVINPIREIFWKYISQETPNIDTPWFDCAQQVLVKLTSSILQTPPKDISILYESIISKSAGAASTTGLLGLIAIFGSASTGTTISSLTGVAATNATYFWLGSIVGGGVAAGGGISLAATVFIGWIANKIWKGSPRSKKTDLIDEEKRIIGSVECLLPALKQEAASNTPLSQESVEWLTKFWEELIQEVISYERKAGNKLLRLKHRIRLQNSIKDMKFLQERIHEINNHD